ncbi:hypothetical protein NQ317_005195 [Molorchus minor]|uniref:Secreted protein n=1 Tax=Molorchus minor TaxID=1323400 RepID=A0ABQ9IZM3_9CUCU|nr:hypothetical protein NQ317_005195 [Molorchus minor]
MTSLAIGIATGVAYVGCVLCCRGIVKCANRKKNERERDPYSGDVGCKKRRKLTQLHTVVIFVFLLNQKPPPGRGKTLVTQYPPARTTGSPIFGVSRRQRGLELPPSSYDGGN